MMPDQTGRLCGDMLILLQGDAHLMQPVLAGGRLDRTLRRRYRRKQQGRQDPDDRNHHQQFDQGKPRRNSVLIVHNPGITETYAERRPLLS